MLQYLLNAETQQFYKLENCLFNVHIILLPDMRYSLSTLFCPLPPHPPLAFTCILPYATPLNQLLRIGLIQKKNHHPKNISFCPQNAVICICSASFECIFYRLEMRYAGISKKQKRDRLYSNKDVVNMISPWVTLKI